MNPWLAFEAHSNHTLIPVRLDSSDSASYYATVVIARFMGKQLVHPASHDQVLNISVTNG
jgi:hypothetical protein